MKSIPKKILKKAINEGFAIGKVELGVEYNNKVKRLEESLKRGLDEEFQEKFSRRLAYFVRETAKEKNEKWIEELKDEDDFLMDIGFVRYREHTKVTDLGIVAECREGYLCKITESGKGFYEEYLKSKKR
jgi:hypothetical protein